MNSVYLILPLGIMLVKIDDEKEADEYGIETFPAIGGTAGVSRILLYGIPAEFYAISQFRRN